MVDKTSVQDYSAPTPGVESIDDPDLRIFCGEPPAPIGTAVAIKRDDTDDAQRVYAVIRHHVGTRRADVWLPASPDWLEEGLPVEQTDTLAGFAPPTDATPFSPTPELVRPGREGDVPIWPSPPDWNELAVDHPPVDVGIDPIDSLAPFVRDGLNLVIDTGDDTGPFDYFARRIQSALSPDQTLLTSRRSPEAIGLDNDELWHVDAGARPRTHIASLQLTIALATRLRRLDRTLAVVELPQPDWPDQTPTPPTPQHEARDGLADIVDRLGRHLVSTADASLTTLLRLDVPRQAPELTTIIDSLQLGDVDATVFVDESGRFVPQRSRSNAELDDDRRRRQQEFLRIIERARKARDKTAIFGDQELDEAERAAIERAEQLRPPIAP